MTEPSRPGGTGSQPEPASDSAADAASGDARGRGARDGEREEREDIHALVITTLNQNLPGINITQQDIDRAHRLPGRNHRVIVRFVRSGDGSVRDRVMGRRLELAGKDLYVSESLTKLRGQIFRSLINAKKQKKLYTVYTRGGQVYFKSEVRHQRPRGLPREGQTAGLLRSRALKSASGKDIAVNS